MAWAISSASMFARASRKGGASSWSTWTRSPGGPNYLRFGGQAVATQGEGRFSVIVQHTHTWLNSWGAEWRNEVTFGDFSRFETSLYQPLGPGQSLVRRGQPRRGPVRFRSLRKPFPSSDRITTSNQGFLGVLGRRLGGVAVARAGVWRQWFTTRPAISSRIDETAKDSADFAFLGANFDTLDDTNFPRRGYLVSGATARYWFDSAASSVQSYSVEALLPFTFGRLHLSRHRKRRPLDERERQLRARRILRAERHAARARSRVRISSPERCSAITAWATCRARWAARGTPAHRSKRAMHGRTART
jgi:hypothetical protein